jgi:O-antigen/teichoic acid export membrane protein
MLLLIVLPVLLLHGNYLYAIYGWIAGSLVSLIIAGYFKGVPFKGTEIREADLSYREVFAYSLPLVSASIAGIAIKAADQFYISAFFGAEVFAEFSNGFIELPFVMMITGATSTVLMPIFSRMKYDREDMGQVITLFRNAILKSATLIYPLVTFFLFNAEAAIVTLFSSTYTNSAIYFQIAMLLNFFNVIIFAPLLFAMGKTKLYSNVHIVFAFAIWTLGYPVVVIFNSPIGLANLSVCLGIVKIMVLTKLTAESMRVTVYSLIPFKRIVVLIVHSFITVIFVKILLSYTLPQTSELLSLILNFGGCIALILLTGNLFSLNYKLMLQALWDKRTILSNV